MREMRVRSLGQEVPREEGMATHCSILARKIECSLAGYSPWGRKEWNTSEVTEHPSTESVLDKFSSENTAALLIWWWNKEDLD